MTLEEAKDQIAKKYGFDEWQYIDWYHLDFMYDVTEEPYMQETCTNEAAELYARSKAFEAWEACRQDDIQHSLVNLGCLRDESVPSKEQWFNKNFPKI